MRKKPPRSILVIAKMTYGDFVLLLPLLAELKRRHPIARLTVICGERGSNLCRLYSCVDQVLNLGHLRLGKGFFRTLAQLLSVFRSDLIYALHPIFFSGLFAFLLCGRYRIGFSQAASWLFDLPPGHFVVRKSVSPLRQWLLQRVLLSKSAVMETKNVHAADRFLQLLEPPPDRAISLTGQMRPLYPRSQTFRSTIILAPFSGWMPRNWPLHRWVELAAKLQEIKPNMKIVVSADPASENLVRGAFASDPTIDIFVPGEDFDHLFRRFSNASLVVANDSFPLHAASALNIPSVGLFGPNIPKWFGGKSDLHDDLFIPIECSPCVQRQRQRPCLRGLLTCAALDALSVEIVASRCAAVLDAEIKPPLSGFS